MRVLCVLLVIYIHLITKFCVVGLKGVIVSLENFELFLQEGVVFLKLLSFPPGSPVLEPNGNLSGVQPKGLSKLQLPLRLKLVPQLKTPLECLHLFQLQPPLLLSYSFSHL